MQANASKCKQIRARNKLRLMTAMFSTMPGWGLLRRAMSRHSSRAISSKRIQELRLDNHHSIRCLGGMLVLQTSINAMGSHPKSRNANTKHPKKSYFLRIEVLVLWCGIAQTAGQGQMWPWRKVKAEEQPRRLSVRPRSVGLSHRCCCCLCLPWLGKKGAVSTTHDGSK